MTEQITLTRPDDWHIHLRDGVSLTRTVSDAAHQFSRAIVMPNLAPPVMNTEQALAYKTRIHAAAPAGSKFEPLMVLYLTDNTDPAEIAKAKAAGITACKLYPAGATTNSASGVTDLKKIYPVLEAMEKAGMHFLLHGEVTDSSIDIFDREKEFLDRTFSQVVQNFPALKMVLEHITTADAAAFVEAAPQNLRSVVFADKNSPANRDKSQL